MSCTARGMQPQPPAAAAQRFCVSPPGPAVSETLRGTFATSASDLKSPWAQTFHTWVASRKDPARARLSPSWSPSCVAASACTAKAVSHSWLPLYPWIQDREQSEVGPGRSTVTCMKGKHFQMLAGLSAAKHSG